MMNGKELRNYPLNVERIRLKDGTSLHDKTVFFYNGFLVVDNDGDRPNMYNVDQIVCLLGVEEVTTTNTGGIRICWV